MSHRTGNPKITTDDYETLRLLMLDSPLSRATTERERWDALWFVVDRNHEASRFLFNVLYHYLADSHIDTALRKIAAGSAIKC